MAFDSSRGLWQEMLNISGSETWPGCEVTIVDGFDKRRLDWAEAGGMKKLYKITGGCSGGVGTECKR
jgi:hypothetical protein